MAYCGLCTLTNTEITENPLLASDWLPFTALANQRLSLFMPTSGLPEDATIMPLLYSNANKDNLTTIFDPKWHIITLTLYFNYNFKMVLAILVKYYSLVL